MAEHELLVDTSVDVAAPISVVWDVLADTASYRRWNPYLVRVDGEPVAGSVITVHAAIRGVGEVDYPVDVVAVEPPHHMRWEGGFEDRDAFRGDHHWELTAVTGDRTHVRHWEVLSGSRRPEVVPDGDGVRAHFQLFNEALRAEAERRAAATD